MNHCFPLHHRIADLESRLQDSRALATRELRRVKKERDRYKEALTNYLDIPVAIRTGEQLSPAVMCTKKMKVN